MNDGSRVSSALGGVALLATLALLAGDAGAQAPRRAYRIGVLNEAWAANHPTVEGLKSGLRELGLEEGRDVTFDIRFTEGNPQATPVAAAALVKAGVDLIFTSNEAATQAAKAATQRLPIVFTLVGDPVAAGIVTKLAQPGGNLTGVSSLTTELVPKRLEALKTLMPTVRRVWAIYYAADPSSIAAVQKAQDTAPRLKLGLVARPVRTPEELERVFQDVQPGDALLPPDIAIMDIPAVMLEVSLSSRVPAVFPAALWVGHGGLVSYGSDYHAQGVQAARLVAKILRGARPQDLPVEGADKIDLAVNLKTAALLGVTVPRKILLRADMLRR
ncbi:MAG TPA: ABC transporter substrate-binding protein [Methylomirabilota bacterium]|jgi:putative ABC transport system substrate-binding protein|nr:ABC transporter substrate-binding protein [Methylomirabilota bacterium]